MKKEMEKTEQNPTKVLQSTFSLYRQEISLIEDHWLANVT